MIHIPIVNNEQEFERAIGKWDAGNYNSIQEWMADSMPNCAIMLYRDHVRISNVKESRQPQVLQYPFDGWDLVIAYRVLTEEPNDYKED